MKGINGVALNKVSPEIEQLVIWGARAGAVTTYQYVFEQFIGSGEKVMEIASNHHKNCYTLRASIFKAITTYGFEGKLSARVYNGRAYLVRI